MSFQSRLHFDSCTYKHNLKQSVGTGDYMLGTPLANCRICFSTDPAIRLARGSGVSTCDSVPLIDADSELKNLTRRASDCPTEKYLPTGKAYCHTHDYKDCTTLPTEDTRISNPTCTMRCTGVNRWEWLCQNPQEKALIPFDFNINNRLVIKDNKVVGEERLLADQNQRFRSTMQGKDGALYAITDEGRLYRIAKK